MDYEEKYERALKKAQELQENSNGMILKKWLWSVFPELKESEDERIRKVLIDYFNTYKEQEECGIKTFFGIPTDNILAWLEKQGDNNNQSWKPSKGQISAFEHFVRSIEESGYALPYDSNTKLLNSLINDLKKLEKQGEKRETLCDECRKTQPSHSCQDITALGRCAIEKQDEQKPFDYENANIQQKDFAPKIEPKSTKWSEEDEKIRKRIVHALHGDVLTMEEINKALAWLEKQSSTSKEVEIVEHVRDIISHPSRYVIPNKTVEEAMINDIVELLQNN